VRWIDEVLDIALERPLTPNNAKVEDAAKAAASDTPKEPVAPTPVRPH